MSSEKAKATDLFLLMVNLSQIILKEKIIDVFMEAIQEIWPNMKASLQLSQAANHDNSVQISTAGSNYGYLIIDNFSDLRTEDQALLHNAVVMLAVILKNNEQGRLLADEKEHLRKLVEESTEYLNKEIQEHIQTKEKYQDLYENAPDMYGSVDPVTACVLQCNQTLVTVTGYSKEEIIGKPVFERYHADCMEDAKIAFEQFQQTGEVHNAELQLRHKSGAPIDILLNATAVRDKSGNILYSRSSWRDIRERKQAEKAEKIAFAEISHLLEVAKKSRRALLSLVEDEKKARDDVTELNEELEQRVTERTAQLESANKELEAFAYSVSHDLRAPLRAIDGFSRFLLEDYADKLDDEGKRRLNIIRTNTQKMDELITDILALSRVSRTEISLSRIDMTTLINSVYHELASSDIQEKFVFSVAPLPDAFGDPILIRQVWVNLISNAIKYSMPKEERKIEIGGQAESGMNIYFIKDTGVGFNPDYTHKLFGLFQRLHSEAEFEGTGVGLAIVQRIIIRHGGKVWAEGQVNEGATFWFSIPIKEVL